MMHLQKVMESSRNASLTNQRQIRLLQHELCFRFGMRPSFSCRCSRMTRAARWICIRCTSAACAALPRLRRSMVRGRRARCPRVSAAATSRCCAASRAGRVTGRFAHHVNDTQSGQARIECDEPENGHDDRSEWTTHSVNTVGESTTIFARHFKSISGSSG